MNNFNWGNINNGVSKKYIRKQKKHRVKRGGYSDDMSQQMMDKLGELKANVQSKMESRMADSEMTGGADGPRHFRMVEVDGRKLNHGIGYIEIKGKQTPLNAAKKLLRSYCRSKGLKGRSKLGVNIKFHIQEVSRGSKHKVFGPYSGRYREYSPEEKKKAMAAGQKFTMKAVVKLLKSGHKKMDGGAKKKRRVVKKKTTKRRRSMRGGDSADSAAEARMQHAAVRTDAGVVGGAKRRRRSLKKKRVVKRKRGGAKPMGMKTHSGGAKKRRSMKKKRVVKRKRGGKKNGQKNNNNNQNGGAKKRRVVKKKRTTKKRRSMRGGSM